MQKTALSALGLPGAPRSFEPKGANSRVIDRLTSLSVTATPSGLQVFEAKIPSGGRGSQQITALNPFGAPWAYQQFDPKTPAEIAANQITALSVMATPGGLRVFDAKTAAEIIEEVERIRGGGGRFHEEDEEILAVIMAATVTLRYQRH